MTDQFKQPVQFLGERLDALIGQHADDREQAWALHDLVTSLDGERPPPSLPQRALQMLSRCR